VRLAGTCALPGRATLRRKEDDREEGSIAHRARPTSYGRLMSKSMPCLVAVSVPAALDVIGVPSALATPAVARRRDAGR
jgi:hypothetical protein